MKVPQCDLTGSGLARPLLEARLSRLGLAPRSKGEASAFGASGTGGMAENMAALRLHDVCFTVREPSP